MRTRRRTTPRLHAHARDGRTIERLENRLALAIAFPTWNELGPAPIIHGQVDLEDDQNAVVGAIEAIAPHPTDPNTVYIGGVNGGIWKTTNAYDAAPVWTPLTDQYPSLSIGAIEFDPLDPDNNTLYASVGKFSSFRGDGGPQTGLLRTTDGGQTWTQLAGAPLNCLPTVVPVDDSLNCTSIRSLVPTSLTDGGQQILLVATDNGLYQSRDGGENFNRLSTTTLPASVLPASAANTVIGDPDDPNRFYASFPGEGVFVNEDLMVDNGRTWKEISDGLGDLTNNGRLELAVQSVPAAGSHMLFAALITNVPRPDGSPGGLLTDVLHSQDMGNSWLSMGVPGTDEGGRGLAGIHPGLQGLRHFTMTVHPSIPGLVYVGGDRQPIAPDQHFGNSIGATEKSGRLFVGNTFFPLFLNWSHLTHDDVDFPIGGGANGTAPHADSRELAFDRSGNLLQGDDGGLYRLRTPLNNGLRYWESLNGAVLGLRTTEMLSISYDSTKDLYFGGTQDNGTIYAFPGVTIWDNVQGGDGVMTAVFTDSVLSVHYTSSQSLLTVVRRADDSDFGLDKEIDLEVQGQDERITVVDATVDYQTPFVTNRFDPQRLLLGTQFLYESFDRGDTLVPIGGFGAQNVGQVRDLVYGGVSDGVPRPNVAWAATSAGLFLRGDPSVTFSRLPAYPGLISSAVAVAIDPDDWRVAYVTDGRSMFRTDDAGVTFDDFTGNLTPRSGLFGQITNRLRSLAVVKLDDGRKAVLVGSDEGVFSAIDPDATSAAWFELGGNLPNAPVLDMQYDATDNLLVVGTFGRGVWTMGSIRQTLADAHVLKITGSSVADTITLRPDPLNPAILQVIQSGAAPLGVPLRAVRRIEIEGMGGSDTITIDRSTVDATLWDPLPPDGISVNGGTGSLDRLIVESPPIGVEEYHVRPGVLEIGAREIEYSNLDRLEVNAGGDADTFFVHGTKSGTKVFLDTGGGGGEAILNSLGNDDTSGTLNDIRSEVRIVAQPGEPFNVRAIDTEDAAASEFKVTEDTLGMGGSLFGNNGFLRYESIAFLVVFTGSNPKVANGHVVRVHGTATGTPVSVIGSEHRDQFFVSSTGGLKRSGNADGVRSQLTFGGRDGDDSLSVFDVDDARRQILTVHETTMGDDPDDDFFGADGFVAFSSIETLDVAMGSGGNDLFVERTDAEMKNLLATTGGGRDKITLGDRSPVTPNRTSRIAAAMTIDGEGDANLLILDDSGDPAGVAATIASTTVGAGAFDTLFGLNAGGARGKLTYKSIAGLSLTTGDFDDTISVRGTLAETVTGIVTGDGGDMVTIGNPSHRLDDVLGKVNVNLGAGANDGLFVDDAGSNTADGYRVQDDLVGRFTPTAVTIGVLNSAELETFELRTGGDNDTIIAAGIPALSALVEGEGGLDTLVAAGEAGAAFYLTRMNGGTLDGSLEYRGIENLRGSLHADRFTVAPAGGLSGTLEGKEETDTLDYSAWVANVTVNLPTGRSQAIGARIAAPVSGVEDAIGGSGYNVLVGDEKANRLTGGSARDLLIGGVGLDDLFGGDQQDILIHAATQHDKNPTALAAIMAEWTRGDRNYSARIKALRGGGGMNGTTVLTTATVFTDLARDHLFGQGELDWFLLTFDVDSADRKSNETRTNV